MKSGILSASILAIAVLASASSFAEVRVPGLDDQPSNNGTTSTTTRAEVKAELLQAQREGNLMKNDRDYPALSNSSASTKTRAEVKAGLMQAQREGNLAANSSLYSGQ